MQDTEARALEEALREALLDSPLSWVVAQVDELVVEGVYEVAKKRKGGPTSREKVERPSDARQGEGSVRSYRDDERLRLLISATRRAVRDSHLLEEAVHESLLSPAGDDSERTRLPGRGALEFYDERTREARRVLQVDRDRQKREEVAQSLIASLDQLGRRAAGGEGNPEGMP
jgi:hypothetical protein